tara:strand:- start:95 stop:751 length:657 start_codon:yes stop_codon:yes gene_type:complete
MVNENTVNYLTLTAFGNHFELKQTFNDNRKFIQWTEDNFEYVRYNPRKNVDRWGLSITSLDGGLSGIPDLDSLTEYNYEQGNFNTENFIKETDINVPTPIYDYPGIKELCDEWQPYLFRTHIIKLNPGGYFPPHRDHTNSNFESFRLIMPLFNCSYPSVTFISDEKILNWNEGNLYFLDTVKVHYLFNCSPQPSYWLIMNIGTNEETIQKVISSVAIT